MWIGKGFTERKEEKFSQPNLEYDKEGGVVSLALSWGNLLAARHWRIIFPHASTMQEITRRTCQSPLDLLDTSSPVPIDLQAFHSWPFCYKHMAQEELFIHRHIASPEQYVRLCAYVCVCVHSVTVTPADAVYMCKRRTSLTSTLHATDVAVPGAPVVC